MMKPYSITLTCRCSVAGCDIVDSSVQTLYQGEQFIHPNHVPSRWILIGGSLICANHFVEVRVDGKPVEEWLKK